MRHECSQLLLHFFLIAESIDLLFTGDTYRFRYFTAVGNSSFSSVYIRNPVVADASSAKLSDRNGSIVVVHFWP